MDVEPIAARHEAVIDGLADAARADDRVVAAWLQGSRADGNADDFSDIDFYLAIADEAFDGFDKIAFVDRVARVLVHFEPLPRLTVCLLEGPVKLDLLLERQSAVGKPERPAVKVLVDKAGVEASLRVGWEPDDAALAKQVDGLIRMTFQGATWPVRLLRREQWMTQAYSEITLIHNVILPLMLVRHDRRAFARNAMTRERLLPEDERRELDGLAREVQSACVARSAPDAYRAHLRIVELLGRAGRSACAAFGLAYPEDAEREALRFYEREWPR